MSEDLRRQASELYKERTQKEEIPTSDSLSMKKLFFIALGLSLLLVVVLQTFGVLRNKPAPPGPRSARPPLVREEAPADAPQEAATLPDPELSKPVEPETKPQTESPSAAARPVAKPDPSGPKKEIKRAGPREKSLPEGTEEEGANAAAQTPVVSPADVARQETARDIVLEQSPALGKMISSPGGNLEYKGWKAEAEGANAYQVIFTFTDTSSGNPVLYVWRVDLTARSILPLSYYARKLS